MVAKTMIRERFCQSCSQIRNCQEVRERLGHAEGPSVVSKVVLAFLLPMLAFILALAVFETILAGMIESERLRTGLSLLLALSVTLGLIVIVRAVRGPVGKAK